MLRLLEAGERVAVYQNDADWYDIGTFSEYERASRDLEARPDAFRTGARLAQAGVLTPAISSRNASIRGITTSRRNS